MSNKRRQGQQLRGAYGLTQDQLLFIALRPLFKFDKDVLPKVGLKFTTSITKWRENQVFRDLEQQVMENPLMGARILADRATHRGAFTLLEIVERGGDPNASGRDMQAAVAATRAAVIVAKETEQVEPKKPGRVKSWENPLREKEDATDD